jgi:aspartate carbamoyltransferase catalytic subunit
MSKGETLIDTARTLNAMRPDVLIVRHGSPGAAGLLARHTEAAVINAGDGAREHPTQALLDALALRRAFGDLAGLTVAVCGDVLHSRVARSSTALLGLMSARVRLCGPPTLLPTGVDRWGAEVFTDLDAAIEGADAVMMLRLQTERMDGAYVPSPREYARFWGLTRERLARAAPGAKVMHPGPMNRGVEITGELADDPSVSLITEQVELGVAVRMAVLASLAGRAEA